MPAQKLDDDRRNVAGTEGKACFQDSGGTTTAKLTLTLTLTLSRLNVLGGHHQEHVALTGGKKPFDVLFLSCIKYNAGPKTG